VAELFDRYRGSLSAQDAQLLQRLAARADTAADVALSGLILSKLGLSIAPEFVQSLLAVFQSVPREGAFLPLKSGVRLDVTTANTDRDPAAIEALASVLQQLMSDLPETSWRQDGAGVASQPYINKEESVQAQRPEADGGEGASAGRDALSLARWILNAQPGGSLAHRTLTVPVLLDGRLVELDIAMFEQRTGREDAAALRHRHIVLSLDTEQLGRVEIQALLAGDRVRINVQCDRAEASEFMAAYSTHLTSDMAALGFNTDELRYAVRENRSANAVVRAVAEHLVSPGSVSRLI